MGGSQVDDGAFVVLFVCTGNICRSPLAEQLFRNQMTDLADLVVVSSAGTRAMTGSVMTAQAAALSRKYGGDPSAHEATDLTVDRVRRANLILTATRDHRAQVVSLVPRASRTSFTIREFCRLLRTYSDLNPVAASVRKIYDAEALKGLVADVASMRGMSKEVVFLGDDDIVDPYRRSQTIYEKVGCLIDDSVRQISNFITRKLPDSDFGSYIPSPCTAAASREHFPQRNWVNEREENR